MGQEMEQADSPARPLLVRGLAEAAAIGNPVSRARHRASWALRLSALEPKEAVALASEFADEPETVARILVTAATDSALRGETELLSLFASALEAAAGAEADVRLRTVNSLCEIAIEVAERDRDAALSQLRLLVPVVRSLTVEGADFQQFRVLGSALVGEALLVLGDAVGQELLAEAEQESEDVPGRDPVVTFLANAQAPHNPEHAVSLVDGLQDPSSRLEARLQLLAAIEDPTLRQRLIEGAEKDALLVEHYHGPEAVVRLASALVLLDPPRSESLFNRALESVAGSGGQMLSLQWTGIASALSDSNREWSLRLFRDAEAAANEEAEPVRRVTSLALIANEMAEPFPREAAEVFSRAMQEAQGLEAMWELAHVNDVVFRADRSTYLDVSPALPVLERGLARLADDDPRIPGVFGLPEVAQSFAQIEPARGVEVLQRWLQAARAAGDTDGMTQAALAIHRTDAEQGVSALAEVHDLLLRRIDCPSMGEFSRTAADLAPELVLSIAPHIPDRRERADAVAAAAIGLYPTDPIRSLQLIGELERPVDRSSALMRIVDRLLHTSDRAEPQPLMEDLP